MRKKIQIQNVLILCAALVLCAAWDAHAGFRMYAPGNPDPIMNSTETDQEKAAREARDEYHRQETEKAEAMTPKRSPAKTTKTPWYTPEQLQQGKPGESTNIDDGPRPGGHRRHEWREKTGFNTPADRARYEYEVRRLKRELRKERAKPNPAGDHPEVMRKKLNQKN